MSSEIITNSDEIESVDSYSDRHFSRTTCVAAWVMGSGLLLAGGIVATEFFTKDTKPCESSTTLDGSFSSSSQSLTLPDGRKVTFSIFPEGTDLNTKNPQIAVSAGTGPFDGTRQIIDTSGKPGPEAVFTFGHTRLLVEATDSTITTHCQAVTAIKN